MAVPKRRQSKSRSAIRRAQVMKQAVPHFVPCPRPSFTEGPGSSPREVESPARGSPAMPRIAVDAMGADASPRVEVEGVVAAVRERGTKVVLVGDETRLRAELKGLGAEREK